MTELVLGATRRAGPRSLPQVAVTTIVPLRPEIAVAEMQARLEDLASRHRLAFAALGNVHFARWVVVGKTGRAWIAYQSDVDGEVQNHLHDLATRLGHLIDAVYADAVGYPAPTARHAGARERFLASIHVGYEALHIGHPGIDIATVRNDVEVRRALGAILDEDARAGGVLRRLPSRAAHDEVVRRLRRRHPELWLGPIEDGVIRRGQPKAFIAVAIFGAVIALVLAGDPPGPAHWWWTPAFVLGGALGALLLLALVVVVVLLVLKQILPRVVAREEAGGSTTLRRQRPERQGGDGQMERIFASEKPSGQNALTHIAVPKKAPFRWFLARAVFFVVELVARIEYVNGALGNITSIHFARWLWIDGGDSLLFFSNYDGTWESYLGEFTDKQATWLSAVWSNCEGFPPTEGLFEPTSGAGQEEHFKLWTRDNEVLTPFWYAAYPTLAVRTVLDNAAIRASLYEGAGPKRIATWMERA